MSDKNRERFLYCFLESNPEKLRALGRLFKRPWWTRIWIAQEFPLAKQGNAIVRSGKHESTWWSILVTAYAINEFWNMVGGIIWEKYLGGTIEGHQHGIRLAQCRKVDAALPHFALLESLNQHRDCAATDSREKVYVSLASPETSRRMGKNPPHL